MLTSTRRIWIAAYAAVLLGPVAFVFVGGNPGDTSTGTLFAVSVGWIAFSGLVLQVILSSRARSIVEPFGADLLLRFHARMGLAIALLVTVHVATMLVDNPDRLGEIASGSPGYVLGVVALVAMASLVATSWPRARGFGSHERWRLVHAVLAAAVLAGAFSHVLLTGHHVMQEWVRWTAFVLVAVAAIALFAVRVGRPFVHSLRPYRLLEVHPERGSATTMVLAPTVGRRMPFRPGQFAWIKQARAPYSLSEHPFSFSSSAHDPNLAFTIRSVGDFTASVRALTPGSLLIVDGPHGSFRPALPDAGYVLIVAGSGIAPAMSILKTLHDDGDLRPVQLVYGTRTLEEATFLEELQELVRTMALELVWVLSRPPPDWHGHRGRISHQLLTSVLTADARARNVFVCGPGPMMATALESLRVLRIPHEHVHVERFE